MDVGADQRAVAVIGLPAVPELALPIVGALGTVPFGVTAADRADVGPLPLTVCTVTSIW